MWLSRTKKPEATGISPGNSWGIPVFPSHQNWLSIGSIHPRGPYMLYLFSYQREGMIIIQLNTDISQKELEESIDQGWQHPNFRTWMCRTQLRSG
jgi:hypothetical protein